MKHSLKWSPAEPVYPVDNIISSKARQMGDFGFKPTFEANENINMCFILNNEYMRLWFKERDAHHKDTFGKKQRAIFDASVKRAFVQKIRPYKKGSKELPIIELKRFQNIMSKVDTRRTQEEKLKIFERKKIAAANAVPEVYPRYKILCNNKNNKKLNDECENEVKKVPHNGLVEAEGKIALALKENKQTPCGGVKCVLCCCCT